ncbi:MAG: prolipoprotein diacylglyceryl transferase [Patescibacteria group bacterium]
MYPLLFESGFISVYSLWFFVAVGFVVSSWVFISLGKRMRIRMNALMENSFLLLFWTATVSRLFFVFLHPDHFFYRFSLSRALSILAIWDKGFSFWGAVFAWFLAVWFFSHKQGESSKRLFDLAVPAVLIGMFFGNIGTFLDGINYGKPTDLPWGMMFRNSHVKYISDIHPTQLYAALYSLIIGLAVIFLLKKTRGALPGLAAEVGVFLFSFFKFLEEFFRGDETIKIFWLRLPQVMAFFVCLWAGYLLFLRYHDDHGSDPNQFVKKFMDAILSKLKGRRGKPSSGETSASLRSLPAQTR